MSEKEYGPEQRLARVRAMLDERAYDGILIRDEANLRWLTGATDVFDFTGELPHVALITREKAYLHTDSRYFNSFMEHMPKSSPWQIDMDAVPASVWAQRRAASGRCRTVAIEDSMELSFHGALLRAIDDASLAIQLPLLHADLRLMRAVKDPSELELMARAQSITDAAFEHMLEFIKPGLTEKQIRIELDSNMFSNGADGLAFASIVASGPNTANPHAIPTDRVVCKGDLVLMDYGATYRDYCSDMTRTICLGEPSDEQRAIYDLVRFAHESCASAIRAGVDGRDIYELSRRIIDEAGYGAYYAHSLGHGVGIEVHELPVFGRSSNLVEAGAVITVEPGVYLPDRGGVRLEDFGVVTQEGYRPFTASPHELQIIDC
ncbi:peptidase M24 [Coriobacterium glomerans PW2]|uniref:Peptidase M24 n=1 Tax=Coriobacterium glomerans (strain ATCC 49209 / DSM 20642 / JCM 10262 / PW2) TaxID=700015 RepID=F2N7Z5_CORGP|nr:Xaa-Pro peptidase family protein [Coriobacterium glomerans]AEB07104.1 peptidase M24 [Coriobacterium glomerans PW2]